MMFTTYDFFDYLNRHDSDKTYAKIITYLLTHQTEVQTLTISQIAERCFVSPATLTRFCQAFNIPSFGDLRELLNTNQQMKSYNYLRMRETDFQ
ncbi:MurR/RpiR family transcriptional regulator [uncultured Enterococcus sp.]|nr:hypothetical protein [uncultured Enterococcus sp.]